jgi:hypothetical protein
MEDKLVYLNDYNQDVHIVASGEALDAVPALWRTLAAESSQATRKSLLLQAWKPFQPELSNTIAYLGEHLEGIDLISYNGQYSLLYTVKNQKGAVLYYEGRNPLSKNVDPRLQAVWNRLPPKLAAFYDTLHNGFYYYASESMGLSPIESVTNLDDLEWGILEELKDPLQISLKDSYGFFTNGMGGYVVTDTSGNDRDKGVLWWAKKPPRYGIRFWDVIDEWTVIGFQQS